MPDKIKSIPEAFTFDDVLLKPAASSVLPSDANTQTRLTRRISLNIPLISAAMDTVTESQLAITMAQNGGIGIIHKNMEAEEQAAEVASVKRYEAGMVVNPVTIDDDKTLSDALDLMQHNKISGIPVVSAGDNVLVGILTNRDVRFATDPRQPVSDMMTHSVITVTDTITPDEARRLLHKHRIEKLVVVDKDKHCVGLITVKDMEKSQNYPNASKDNSGRLMVGAAVGTGAAGIARAEALIYAGADAIKIGIGPGSICTTRMVAGVGVPQLTAVMEAAAACHRHGVPAIADGGIKYSGDLAKAIAAGADAVMIGTMLAGTDETPGEVYLYQGRSYKAYRGMGSIGAMARGSADRYFQAEVSQPLKLVPEGIEGQVPYKGSAGAVIHQMIGGLRAAMGYTGCATIDAMHSDSQFVRITGSGLKESHVHDVTITREAPNYRHNM